MKGKIFLFAILCTLAYSIRFHTQNDTPSNEMIVGGWSTGNVNNVNK
jgi:hypothetical protein